MTDQDHYQCMFCAQGIAPGGLDPCALHLVAHIDKSDGMRKEQTFFCHFDCLRARSGIDPADFYISEPDYATVGEIEAEQNAT